MRRYLEDLLHDAPWAQGTRASAVRRGSGCREGRASGRADTDVATIVPPLGWERPQIQPRQRSPIKLRPRFEGGGGPLDGPDTNFACSGQTAAHEAGFPEEAFSPPPPDRADDVAGHVSFFTLGTSPPPNLIQDPVHSPSNHRILDSSSFPEMLQVTVQPQILDLDSSLVGDENGVRGVVLSRFFHHVTGTSMFQVDFGGAISFRSVRVSDSAADVNSKFTATQRMLFPLLPDTRDLEELSQALVEENSDDDPDWIGEYYDFVSDEAADESGSDLADPSYTEDPLRELGLYDYDEDISGWTFDELFADEQWQEQSVTLLQNTHNFCGPTLGPTTTIASRPMEYFLHYWPPHILQRMVDETNR